MKNRVTIAIIVALLTIVFFSAIAVLLSLLAFSTIPYKTVAWLVAIPLVIASITAFIGNVVEIAEFIFKYLLPKPNGDSIRTHQVVEQEARSRLGLGVPPSLSTPYTEFEHSKQELKQFIGILQKPPTRPTCALLGPPCVGKTTLLASLVQDQEITDAFPNGVFWITLGQKPEIRTKLGALGQKFGVVTREELGEQTDTGDFALAASDISNRLKDYLSDKQMLLILDDVWNAAHTAMFRVGGNNRVLIVSTRVREVAERTSYNNIYEFNGLSDTEAKTLLSHVAGSVVTEYPAECDALLSMIDNNPLAIKVAGGMMESEHHQGWSITDLMDEISEGALLDAQAPVELTDQEAHTTPQIASLLKLSTNTERQESLTDDDVERFALLGAYPLGSIFEFEAISEVWEIENPRPELRTLINKYLVEHIGNRRYVIPSLLMMHASSLKDKLEDTGKVHRAHIVQVRRGLKALRDAQSLYRQGGDKIFEALALFDDKQLQITGAWKWLMSQDIEEDIIAELRELYPRSGIDLLVIRQNPEEHIRWLQAAEEAAQKEGNPEKLVLIKMYMGNALYRKGDFGVGVETLEEALSMARDLENSKLIAMCLTNAANVHRLYLGAYGRAIAYADEAIGLSNNLEDTALGERIRVACLGTKANTFEIQNLNSEALALYHEVLNLIRQHEDREDRVNEAMTIGNIGNCYQNLGEYERAREFYKEALDLSREQGYSFLVAKWLGNLGNAHRGLGQYQQAEELLIEGVDLARKNKDQDAETRNLQNLGLTYTQSGQPQKAIPLHEEGRRIASRIGGLDMEAYHLEFLGDAYRALGDQIRAKTHYEQALMIFDVLGILPAKNEVAEKLDRLDQ